MHFQYYHYDVLKQVTRNSMPLSESMSTQACVAIVRHYATVG